MKKNNIKLSDKAALLKERIIANANELAELADRILNRAIAEEEREEAWKKRKAELKEIAEAKLEEKRKEKKEKRKEKRMSIFSKYISKSIPTSINKNDQEKIDDKIREAQEKKAKAEDEKIQKKKDLEVKTKEEAAKKKAEYALRKVHNGNKNLGPKTHTTKEERKIVQEETKEQAYKNYIAMMQQIESEKAADPEGYAKRKQKKQEAEQKRLEQLAEKRKARMEKQQKTKVTQKSKVAKILEAFKQAQLARKKKKEEKRAKYLTKGGIAVPKVKIKVVARPFNADQLVKRVNNPKVKDYFINIYKINDNNELFLSETREMKIFPGDLLNFLTLKNKYLAKKDKKYAKIEAKVANVEKAVMYFVSDNWQKIVAQKAKEEAFEKKEENSKQKAA